MADALEAFRQYLADLAVTANPQVLLIFALLALVVFLGARAGTLRVVALATSVVLAAVGILGWAFV